MNLLSYDKLSRVIATLAEGTSIRGTARLCGCDKDTVMAYGRKIGEGCWCLHDTLMDGVQVDLLEFDEIWGFVQKKQRRVKDGETLDHGDQYTFLGMDATKKGIIGYMVGKRTEETCHAFVRDIKRRIVNRPQISTDGFQSYPAAIAAAFGREVDYAMIIKTYRMADYASGEYCQVCGAGLPSDHACPDVLAALRRVSP